MDSDVAGELLVQPFLCANKATLNQKIGSAIDLLGIAIEFLEDYGGLLERTRREKREIMVGGEGFRG